LVTEVVASPADHDAAPRRRRSLMKNTPAPAGTSMPSTTAHEPGVLARKLNVVTNIGMVPMLPTPMPVPRAGERR
jgi:hypothetical protein